MARLPKDTSIRPGVRLSDFSNYEILVERVAAGGFGVVAFGPDRLTQGRMTALKTLHRLLLEHTDTRNRFVEECLLWIGLWRHPNVIVVYGVTMIGDETSSHRPFIVLEYAEHGSLRDLLVGVTGRTDPGGRLPLETGLHFAQQITAGLVYLHTPDPTYLHKEPTVHRDLKPENVLLLEDGRVAITDFGLAKAVTESPQAAALLALFSEEDDEDDDQETSSSGTTLRAPSAPTRSVHTRRGQAMGTLEYTAPEQWASAAEVGLAADIYALGIMLSELLAGRHALLDLDRRHSSRQWQEAHARPATPSQPRGRSLREVEPAIPAEVEAIYRRCLAIEPDQRPTAAQVLAVLQQAAQERELEVYEPYEIAEHTPDNELTHWHNWGNAYFRFERYEQALVCNDRALELAPHDAEVLITRGNILLMLQRWAEAEAAYQQALSELPAEDTWHRAGVWNMFGVLYNASERYGKAEAAYQQSLAVEPSKANTVYNRALNQRDWARAEEQAERREEAVAHLGLARVHAVTGIGLGLAPCQQLLTFIEQDLARLGER